MCPKVEIIFIMCLKDIQPKFDNVRFVDPSLLNKDQDQHLEMSLKTLRKSHKGSCSICNILVK